MAINASNIVIFAHIHDKIIEINCGKGLQALSWLGNVAVMRWDVKFEGWTYLGSAVGIKLENQPDQLNMDSKICDLLRNGDHVQIKTSMNLK